MKPPISDAGTLFGKEIIKVQPFDGIWISYPCVSCDPCPPTVIALTMDFYTTKDGKLIGRFLPSGGKRQILASFPHR